MNKIKVIDLLNKIESGEKPPKTIKINDNYYEYSGNAKNIYSYKEIEKLEPTNYITSIFEDAMLEKINEIIDKLEDK